MGGLKIRERSKEGRHARGGPLCLTWVGLSERAGAHCSPLRLLLLVDPQTLHHLMCGFGAYEAKGAVIGFGKSEKGQASVPDSPLVENGIATWAGMSRLDAAATVRKPVESVCGNACFLNEAGGGYPSSRGVYQG